VLEAFVAKSPEKVFCALQVFAVVVPNASESAFTVRTSGNANVSGLS
jgi:hypothetical protein